MSRTDRKAHWWRALLEIGSTVGTDDAAVSCYIVDVPARGRLQDDKAGMGLLVISTLLAQRQLSLSV